MSSKQGQNDLFKALGAIALIGLEISGLDAVIKGGCDAADRDQLRRMDAEKKAWQRQEARKARDADAERGKRSWDQISANR